MGVGPLFSTMTLVKFGERNYPKEMSPLVKQWMTSSPLKSPSACFLKRRLSSKRTALGHSTEKTSDLYLWYWKTFTGQLRQQFPRLLCSSKAIPGYLKYIGKRVNKTRCWRWWRHLDSAARQTMQPLHSHRFKVVLEKLIRRLLWKNMVMISVMLVKLKVLILIKLHKVNLATSMDVYRKHAYDHTIHYAISCSYLLDQSVWSPFPS